MKLEVQKTVGPNVYYDHVENLKYGDQWVTFSFKEYYSSRHIKRNVAIPIDAISTIIETKSSENIDEQ